MSLNKTGECETCVKTDVHLTFAYTMWMCDECKAKEDKLKAESMDPVNTQNRINQLNELIDKSRKQDNSIQLKQEIFNTNTKAAVELKAAIEQNESIPESEKGPAYVKECHARRMHFEETIFKMREQLLEVEANKSFWHTQVQTEAVKLRADLREQYRQYDITYQPPKPIKPAKSGKTGKQSPKAAEVKKLAEQYGIPEIALRMRITATNKSIEQAALDVAKMMGKIQ